MRTLFITQELVPYHSTGGMAVLSRDLPAALSTLGFKHTLLLPYIDGVSNLGKFADTQRTIAQCSVSIDGSSLPIEVFTIDDADESLTILFAAQPTVLSGRIYNDEVRLHRSLVMSAAAAAYLDQERARYGLIHALDQLSSLALASLRLRFGARYRYLLNLLSAEYDFTIAKLMDRSEFDEKHALQSWLGSDAGALSAVQLGLIACDKAVTSSPAYRDQLVDRYNSKDNSKRVAELCSVSDKLIGIEQGIDTQFWHPEKSGRATVPISRSSISNDKDANRVRLMSVLLRQHRYLAKSPSVDQVIDVRLPLDPNLKIISYIGRFCHAKGRTTLYQVLDYLETRSDVVVLMIVPKGSLSDVDAGKLKARSEASSRLWFVQHYDQRFAELGFAGADFFMMPSVQEPCGLGQKIAMRYATIPLVTPVGGLQDTVTDATANPATGNGFISAGVEPDDYQALLASVFDLPLNSEAIQRVRKNTFDTDVSWGPTIRNYQSLYQSLLSPHSQRRALAR